MDGVVEKSKSEKIEEGAAPVRTGKMSVRKLRRDGVSIPPIVKISAADVRAIRESNDISQAVLACYLGVSTPAVTQWEQGLREPSGAAVRLLDLIRRMDCWSPQKEDSSTADFRPAQASSFFPARWPRQL